MTKCENCRYYGYDDSGNPYSSGYVCRLNNPTYNDTYFRFEPCRFFKLFEGEDSPIIRWPALNKKELNIQEKNLQEKNRRRKRGYRHD